MTKDIIYIVKRVIIGVLISVILMYIGSLKVNAISLVQSAYLGGGSTTTTVNGNIDYNNLNLFNNLKKGFVYWSISYAPTTLNSGTYRDLQQVFINTNTNDLFTCEIGNTNSYWDANTQTAVRTVKCYVDLTNKKITGISYRFARGDGVQGIQMYNSDLITFVQEENGQVNVDTNSIVNSIQQQTIQQAQQAQQAHQDAQNIQNSLTSEESPANEDLESILDNKSNNNNVANLVMFVPNIFASVGTGLSSNCNSTIQLGNLLGTNLTLTCIRPQNYIGSQLWTIIDFMFLFGLFLSFRKWVVNIYNDLTSLKEVKFN